MSELTEEFRAAYLEWQGIDIAVMFPGLMDNRGFERFCTHIVDNEQSLFIDPLLIVLSAIKDGTVKATKVKSEAERRQQVKANVTKAQQLLREAAKVQGLREDFYTDLDQTASKKADAYVDISQAVAFPGYLLVAANLPGLLPKGGKVADNGFHVRAVSKYLPEDIPDRNVLISDLLAIVGVTVNRQYVARALDSAPKKKQTVTIPDFARLKF